MREYHCNMYIAMCETDDQCKFNAWSRAPKTGALGQPLSGVGREVGHMYTHGRFMAMYGKNYHNIVTYCKASNWKKKKKESQGHIPA